jgi:hypothetical protein
MSIGTGHSGTKPQLAAGRAPQLEPERPPRGGTGFKVTLLGLIAVFVVLAAYDLFSVSGQVGPARVASKATTAAPSASPPGSASQAAPPATATLRPGPRQLIVASIAAFGSAGTTDGDHPGLIDLINGTAGQPWYSSWYATPEFGNLKPGTGLLLDMGKAVTVSGVRLMLGAARGADVELRVGNGTAPADLTTVAHATGVGGSVLLPVTAGATGRYVVAWFTRLPPDGQGHYQIDVFKVTVDGTRS